MLVHAEVGAQLILDVAALAPERIASSPYRGKIS
jgi:hypothetical protein